MANKPNCRQCVNVSTGKTSYLLLKRKGNFPLVAADPAHPNAGEITGAVVKDDDNEFYFTGTVVAQTSRKRLALKIVSNKPAGGDDILEGLLTITLQIFTGSTTDALPVADAPVDYIDDPAGP